MGEPFALEIEALDPIYNSKYVAPISQYKDSAQLGPQPSINGTLNYASIFRLVDPQRPNVVEIRTTENNVDKKADITLASSVKVVETFAQLLEIGRDQVGDWTPASWFLFDDATAYITLANSNTLPAMGNWVVCSDDAIGGGRKVPVIHWDNGFGESGSQECQTIKLKVVPYPAK